MTDTTQQPPEAPDPDAQQDQEYDQEEQEEQEKKQYKVQKNINIQGRDYAPGEMVLLSEEEHKTLNDLGIGFEGDEIEAKKPEELQEAHDQQVEEVRKKVEQARLARDEQFERDKAYEAGREFDEETFKSEYERKRKLTEGDEWKMPEKNEEEAQASQEMKDAERAARSADARTAESVEQTNPRPGHIPPASVGIAQGGQGKT